jgi:hypothetical protein
VQATKEVQLAAQQVAAENAKLRDLLGRIGYSQGMIDAWINEKTTCPPQRADAHRCAVKLAATPTTAASCSSSSNRAGTSPKPLLQAGVPELERSTEPICANVTVCVDEPPPTDRVSANTSPCKLLSLLAENPAADISQIPLPLPHLEKMTYANNYPNDPKDDTGVDCSEAYKLLMQYATSDGKLNKIASALESGCTPSASGVCKVKKSAMWRVLDEECI